MQSHAGYKGIAKSWSFERRSRMNKELADKMSLMVFESPNQYVTVDI